MKNKIICGIFAAALLCSCTQVSEPDTTAADVTTTAAAEPVQETAAEETTALFSETETEAATTSAEAETEEETATEAPDIDYKQLLISAVNENTDWFDVLADNEDGGMGMSYCSFADLDLDGRPEFITGGKTYGAHGAVRFIIYRCGDDGTVSTNEDVMFWPDYDYNYEIALMPVYILKNRESGDIKLVSADNDGTAFSTEYYLTEYDPAHIKEEDSRIASLTIYADDSGEENDSAAEANFKEAYRNVFDRDKYEIYSLQEICTPIYCTNSAAEYLGEDELSAVPEGVAVFRKGEDNTEILSASMDDFYNAVASGKEAERLPFEGFAGKD